MIERVMTTLLAYARKYAATITIAPIDPTNEAFGGWKASYCWPDTIPRFVFESDSPAQAIGGLLKIVEKELG